MTKADRHSEIFSWLPLIVDGGAILLLFSWVRWLSPQLETANGSNAFWLTLHYLLLWVGVWLVRKLIPLVPSHWPTFILQEAQVRGGLALLMALAMTSFIAIQFGFFDSIFNPEVQALNAGETAAFYVLAPSAWFGMALFYILFLAFPIQATISAKAPRTVWLMGGALLFIDMMCLLFWAQAKVVMAGLAYPALIQVLLLILGMGLLFLPPRFLYQDKQKKPWLGFGSFLVLTLVLVGWLL